MAAPNTPGTLSVPLVRKILADHFLVAEGRLRDAVTLVSVCRCWRDCVANSGEWIALYAGSACALHEAISFRVQEEVCKRRLPPGEMRRFLTLWGSCTLAGGVVLQIAPIEDVGLHIERARAEYRRASQKLGAVDPFLASTFALLDVKRMLSTEEHWSLLFTGVMSVLLLAPQGILWLTLRADGIVACPWSVGAGLGVAACCAWFPHISWHLWIALRFVCHQRRVRRLVHSFAQHSVTPPSLIMDWKLGLSSCWCARPLFWTLSIGSIIAWLVMVAIETDDPLRAAALINCVPLLWVAILISGFRLLNDRHDEHFLLQALTVHAILGWVLLFQMLANESTCPSGTSGINADWGCRAKMCFACTSALLPLLISCVLAARACKDPVRNILSSAARGVSSAVDIGCLCMIAVSLAFVHAFVAVLVGRSVRSFVAMRVPLVLFAAPVQILTLLALPVTWETYVHHRADIERVVRSTCPFRVSQRMAGAWKRRRLSPTVSSDFRSTGERPPTEGAVRAMDEP